MRVNPSKRITDSDAEFRGFIPDLMEKVCRKLKVTCHIKLVVDGAYGVKGRGGRWNGVIGEVIRGVCMEQGHRRGYERGMWC